MTVYMLFSCTDVEFQGRPQRPEFITESECGMESPPRGKWVEKAVRQRDTGAWSWSESKRYTWD